MGEGSVVPRLLNTGHQSKEVGMCEACGCATPEEKKDDQEAVPEQVEETPSSTEGDAAEVDVEKCE